MEQEQPLLRDKRLFLSPSNHGLRCSGSTRNPHPPNKAWVGQLATFWLASGPSAFLLNRHMGRELGWFY